MKGVREEGEGKERSWGVEAEERWKAGKGICRTDVKLLPIGAWGSLRVTMLPSDPP